MRTKQSTNEHVDIQKGCKYFKMCYHNNKEGKVDERKQKCKASCLECPIFLKHICDECWDIGYDKHA